MGQLGDALKGPLQRRLKEAGTVGQRDFAAMLNLLGESDLRRCVDEGVAAVATRVGVEVDAIWQRIPFDGVHTLAAEVGHAQANAVLVWNENQSGWASILQGLAGFGLDAFLENNLGLGDLGLGRSLSECAGGKVREERFRQALQPLAAKLQEFEALVEQSATQLDADPELAQALAKKNEGGCGCLLLFVFGCAVLLVGLGYLGWRGWKWAFSSDAPKAASSASSVPAPPAPPRRSPLVGDWTMASGQALRAIELGDAVEFDILRLGPWADQGYAEGEMRFRLRRLGDAEGIYRVEDKSRPAMPKGIKFAPEASESCHVIRSEVDDVPLRARLIGDRLTIESVRTTLPQTAFRWQGRAVVGCAMDRGTESKLELVMARERPGGPSVPLPQPPTTGTRGSP